MNKDKIIKKSKKEQEFAFYSASKLIEKAMKEDLAKQKFEIIQEHYNRIIREIKSILDDDRLTSEEKIRMLGVIL